MAKKYKVKIDKGDVVNVVEIPFNSDIEAAEYCERMTTLDCRYVLLSDRKLSMNKGA